MKTMALMLSLLAAGLGASFALASPGHGHGHGKSDSTTSASTTATTQARACRPTVAYVLNGTFVAAGADGSSFSIKRDPCEPPCEGASAPAPALSVDAKTRIVRNGKKAGLSDLQAGDRLNVQARGCKGAAAGAAPGLVAKRVVGPPGEGSKGRDDDATTAGDDDHHRPVAFRRPPGGRPALLQCFSSAQRPLVVRLRLEGHLRYRGGLRRRPDASHPHALFPASPDFLRSSQSFLLLLSFNSQ